MTGWKELPKKRKNNVRAAVRAGIQLVFFLFFPGAFTAAFHGAKYLFTQIGLGQPLRMTGMVQTLVVLCACTVLFGRFFCGYACAFGSLGDVVHALAAALFRRLGKRLPGIPERIGGLLSCGKYLVLAGIVLLCYAGAWGKTGGMSPWDVFSMLRAGNTSFNGYGPGIVLLVLIVAGMALEERFFCRYLCPMGAVFSLLPVLPVLGLVRDRKECLKGCRACTATCPSRIELPTGESYEVRGDCFQCQRCIGTCPKGNIHCGCSLLKGNEIWFTLLKAAFLFSILFWLDTYLS